MNSRHGLKRDRLSELLLTAILSEQQQLAATFMAEMVLSNFLTDVWTVIFRVYIAHIGLVRPDMINWLLLQYVKSKGLDAGSQQLRNLLAQVVAVLIVQPKSSGKGITRLKPKGITSHQLLHIYQQAMAPGAQAESESDLLNQLLRFLAKPERAQVEAIYFSPVRFKPLKKMQLTEDIATKPVWIIWVMMVQEQPSLQQLFVWLIKHKQDQLAIDCLLLAYQGQSPRSGESSGVKSLFLFRSVIQAVLRVNLTYKQVRRDLAKLGLTKPKRQKGLPTQKTTAKPII